MRKMCIRDRKFFCPKIAKESAKAKHFKGIYLPYWTFDAQTDSTYRAEYGIERTVKENGEEKMCIRDRHGRGADCRS